jgi:hypothetical protein
MLALPMLTVAVWMVQSPRWWVERLDALQEELRRWPSVWVRVTPPAPARPASDARGVAAMRLMGALLAAVAVMNLYQQALWMLAHYR